MLDHIESYQHARTAAHALELLAQPGAVVIAGGTDLVPRRAPGARVLVDISRAGLASTRTLQQLVEDASQPEVVRRAARLSAGRLLRNSSTIGGIVAGRRDCDLLTVLLALGARLKVLTREGEQTLPLDPTQPWPAGALLTDVEIPGEGKAAYERVSRGEPDVAIVGAAVWRSNDGESVRVALGGVSDTPYRLLPVEKALVAGRDDIETLVREHASVRSDFLASDEYRRDVAAVLVRRAWTAVA